MRDDARSTRSDRLGSNDHEEACISHVEEGKASSSKLDLESNESNESWIHDDAGAPSKLEVIA